ncbi:UDP-N-acetylmuramoyl-L-alanine--D-glutamate ligase [Lacticigenium naphthae]|uniref:UDP-N-acetylmuramoyl-L-alanine--D-glutamate ligase n=1 Tax=Lacticigenium naphthae TaxID=515351 RepID=UPI000414896E
MKYTKKYENKKILVLGLAKTGFNAALLLKKLGAKVIINDLKEIDDEVVKKELEEANIQLITGYHPIDLLDDSFNCIVKNPGIPYENKMVQRARELNLPIFTDVEIAFQVLEAPIVGITGTNGKTTVTTLVTDLLNAERKKGKAYSAGNIGIPATIIAQIAKEQDDVIMELSSFQLMGVDQLKPEIAIITNITSAHLDYHNSRKEYVQAKMKITQNQTETDCLIFNADQEELNELIKESKARLVPFSRKKEAIEGVYIKGNYIYYKEEKIMDVQLIKLPGKHNLENVLASIAVAKIKGLDNNSIVNVIQNFYGVSHRMEFVAEYNKVRFYNDSKATNETSTITALESFTAPVILLVGGLDRGDVFESLERSMSDHVKIVIAFGESKSKLIELAKNANIQKIFEVETIAEAVDIAFANSEPGDVVLLSPACASWDQYDDFEERGEDFKDNVKHNIKRFTKGEKA